MAAYVLSRYLYLPWYIVLNYLKLETQHENNQKASPADCIQLKRFPYQTTCLNYTRIYNTKYTIALTSVQDWFVGHEYAHKGHSLQLKTQYIDAVNSPSV